MSTKERSQNPVIGDTVTLRLVSFNSNNYQNVQEIQKVDIYFLDPTDQSCTDPCGSRLVESLSPDLVTNDSEGNYSVALPITSPVYTIGNYRDVWNVVFKVNDPTSKAINNFTIYPDLWYTSTTPAVYGFDFHFTPNRIRQGSKKWIHIRIDPNVPQQTDMQRYYTNIAIAAQLQIFIEQVCGPCITDAEQDLRMIVDGDDVTVRDKVFGHYFLDTTDMDCGIYNVWFSLAYAGTVEISNKSQLQIL